MSEPGRELGAAAVARRHRTLFLAVGRTRRAAEADMEMLVMPEPRPDAIESGAFSDAAGELAAAERRFDQGVDEDALDRGMGGGEPQQRHLFAPEATRID